MSDEHVTQLDHLSVDFRPYSAAHEGHEVERYVLAQQLWFVCFVCDVAQSMDGVAAGLPVVVRNEDELEAAS